MKAALAPGPAERWHSAMKACPVLLALTLGLLSGCQSAVDAPPPAPPVALGEETTPWGTLPRYAEGRLRPRTAFRQASTPAPAPGRVVTDVLVERDGKVRDVRVKEVIGTEATHRAAVALLRDSRYEPLPADGPELYVVSQTIEIKPSTRSRIPSGGINNDGGGNSNMPANAPWPNVSGN